MKQLIFAVTALFIGAAGVHAAGTDQTVMPPEEIVKQTFGDSATSAGFILPLILLALILVAASDGDGSYSE